ncbi:28S ribosomal protein S7, mitochondrial [Condylostylus longicornis]|uniref:28S ribosomal protein S7, mitochondrial n=1 Tax=Condylostylus longicornis TaxID=2530218 RepID=UPI00244DBFE8|nr:28S ribosomal protein S7, mitochondrial [Condylostylus longicornis]
MISVLKWEQLLRHHVVTNHQKCYMSVFPKQYISAVFKKEKQKELVESGEDLKLVHIPIKPARNNDTSSVFHDDLISKYTNYIMRKGKKSLARELLEKTFENIKRTQLERYNLADAEEKEKIVTNPKLILHQAIANCRPLMELTPIKRGGVKYQVPVAVTENRSLFLAMNWLIQASKEKERNVHLPEKMAWELLDAAAGQGRVVKRKNDLHRQCEANRAYAHYRWG